MHNNNNIANELKEIALCLSNIDTKNTDTAIKDSSNEIDYLDTIAQEVDAPELRALSHWMMLNLELTPENEGQILILLEEGSYFNWMNILSSMLRQYDQSLLPEIYKALTAPNWLVKPSAPLLRNLAGWIEASKTESTFIEESLTETIEEEYQTALLEKKSLSSDLNIDLEQKHVFEDIDLADPDKEEHISSDSIEKHLSERIDTDLSQITTEEANNFHNDLEIENKKEESVVNETSKINIGSILEDFSEEAEEITDTTDTTAEKKAEETTFPNESIETESLDLTNDTTNDFSEEATDIVMTLASIGIESENVFDDTERFLAELQRLELLAEISNYPNIALISDWCQQNVRIFAKEQLDESRQFIESGECWTWIELINNALEEPENISHISELSTTLNRDEWLEPLPIDRLQNLLLFLRKPDGGANNTNKKINNDTKDHIDTVIENTPETINTDETENTESPEFTLRWDEDVHPELLEVFFEETSTHVTEVSSYLKNIDTTKTNEEERSHIRRIAHTIKGGSAVVGVTALSTFSHKLEMIFDYAIDHSLSNEANELLKRTSSCLENLYKAVEEKATAPEEFSSVLSELTHYAESLDEDDAPMELSMPVLPDFITQKNTDNTNSNDNESEKEEDSIETIDKITVEETIEESIVDVVETHTENTIEEELKESDKENNKERLEETPLPPLNQHEELNDFTAELDDIVMTLVTSDANTEKKPFKLDNYIEELQRLDMLAEISGFPEIVKISGWYQENLKVFANKSTKKAGKFISSGESWAWLELISACLSDPDEITYLSTLNTELTRSDWIEPLAIEDLQALLLVLNRSNNIETEAENEETEQKAEQEIVQENVYDIELKSSEVTEVEEQVIEPEVDIITWDEDVHPELLSVYLQETSEQVTKIAALLHTISTGKASKKQQEDAARIAHTIKGASGVVGITEIVDFTHKLEDILDYAVNNKIPKKTAELLAESSDCLESLFEAVQEKSPVPEEFEPVLAKLTTYADSIESNDAGLEKAYDLDMPELPDFISSKKTTAAKAKKTKKPAKKIAKKSTPKSSPKAKITLVKKKQKESISVNTDTTINTSNNFATESHIRVPTVLINRLLNLAGELVTTSTQVSDKIESTLSTSMQIKEQDKRVHKMLNELSSTIYKQEKDQMSMLSSMQHEQFDSLEMDTYNELHSIAGLLTESILDSETIEGTIKQQLGDIQNDLRMLDNLNKELSETILSSRMESLNTLVPRLERIVRQTCRKTNKKAELIVTGNDIHVDTEILSGLVDPLLHLLRNAIDHGIEDSKGRKAKKKKVAGQIHLDFSRQGNFIHMQLKDDGAGIDSEKIYQHAINKGLITPDQEYSKSEVLKLILEPGFSTQTSVSNISGRGVGMDVVNKGVEDLKGTLRINSELGKGTTFDIKIPLTLVTSSTLLVSTAGNQVAIPTDSIEQLHYLAAEDVLVRKKQHYIRYEGKELIIESLAGILGWNVEAVDFSQAQTLLLVKGENELHAVYIDKIIQSREVVIKSLAHYIDSSKGVIGACHLTDGAVAPVLNLPQLLSLNEKASYVVKNIEGAELLASNTPSTPQILVVDDSLSNRKALSLIIEKTEYDVITAVDGLDALNIMNEQHIDMVFTDLEMPRMTGLELTQAIRAWDEKKHLPVVMVTSRSTNKHRELAEKAGVDDYLTKPVGTDTLLESMETWLKQTVSA